MHGVRAFSIPNHFARAQPNCTHQSLSLTKPNSNCDEVGQLMEATSALTKDVDVRHTLLTESESYCAVGSFEYKCVNVSEWLSGMCVYVHHAGR